MEYRPAFETFKSNVCNSVKDMGDIEFLIDVTESDGIFAYLEKRWYREGLYLLGMADYLCRENNLPLDDRYASFAAQNSAKRATRRAFSYCAPLSAATRQRSRV
jgi:hypothetical protein